MTATPTEASAPLPATVEELIRYRLSAALGGGRGALETALPTAVFVSWWLIAHDLGAGAVIAAIVVAVILAGIRVAQRQSLQHVLGAVFATALAAWFAMRSGKGRDAFLLASS